MRFLAFLPPIFLSLIGCTSHPDNHSGIYISPYKYKDYSCEQVAVDILGISKKIGSAYKAAEVERQQDQALTTLGMTIFFPALFFLDGDELDLERYGYLKGEMEALLIAGEQKGCNIEILPHPKDFK